MSDQPQWWATTPPADAQIIVASSLARRKRGGVGLGGAQRAVAQCVPCTALLVGQLHRAKFHTPDTVPGLVQYCLNGHPMSGQLISTCMMLILATGSCCTSLATELSAGTFMASSWCLCQLDRHSQVCSNEKNFHLWATHIFWPGDPAAVHELGLDPAGQCINFAQLLASRGCRESV